MFAVLKGGARPDNWPGDRVFVFVMGGLMAFAPLAIDMYLPALPAIGREFAVGQHEVQITLGVYFLGFGIGQLFWGPVGDRFGRRIPIAVGIAVFVAACVLAAIARDVETLIAARFVQALGSSAAPVLARAMVRDVFDRERSAAMFSLMMLVMGAAPMLAPLLGGVVDLWAGWRAIFLALGAFALAVMWFLFRVPETLAHADRRPADWRSVVAGYAEVARDRRFLAYAFSGAFMFAAMFAYIGGTPFVYIEIFGVKPELYGFLFGLNVVGMMAASAVNGRNVGRIGLDRTLRAAFAAAAALGGVVFAVGAGGIGGLWGLVAAIFAFLATIGFIGANATAGALAPFPHLAGTASALAGAIQFGLGAVTSVLAGYFADGTPGPMCAVIAACAVAAFAINRWGTPA
ncbi:MAG: Bcr/CflA family multidrug efflux MFS transporter [Azospirillum sp.]|nr:Bcr/CflA family multidrug efflux MFS transporter [Azospirillum sp.]MCA3267141.1 Bcr/CflA family multidrug efflux MFS transporter [Azospirillum sp.]MCZ8122898.1 Bcr/CflA family multidrug efflux MFS transporter [Magnetospirillum sp.]